MPSRLRFQGGGDEREERRTPRAAQRSRGDGRGGRHPPQKRDGTEPAAETPHVSAEVTPKRLELLRDLAPKLRPTLFRLTVNLQTAKALGITMPQFILAPADEFVE
jgi:hypothetical protein